MFKIIIVEDIETIREELKTFLTRYGYHVLTPSNFENVLSYIEKETPDLILLDINLPVFDGYHICREVRKKSDVPIIIVTSRDSEMDELMSMNLGADDFITKPYNTEILLARIGAVLKRTHGNSEKQQDILMYNDLKLNPTKGNIIYGDITAEVTKNELKILSCLIKNQGQIVSREDLMDYMWNSNIFMDDNTLSVNVTRLRKKLEEIGMEDAIITRRGLGYMMP